MLAMLERSLDKKSYVLFISVMQIRAVIDVSL
jgi:hypothetical protein